MCIRDRRNATATAKWVAGGIGKGRQILMVAAGERWPDDASLRPGLEDSLGAGAVLAALDRLGYGDVMTPEASMAASTFRAAAPDLAQWVARCVSGRELVERGFGPDVEVAAALDSSVTVPVLTGAWFSDIDSPRS